MTRLAAEQKTQRIAVSIPLESWNNSAFVWELRPILFATLLARIRSGFTFMVVFRQHSQINCYRYFGYLFHVLYIPETLEVSSEPGLALTTAL
jgi:hypothetical protein